MTYRITITSPICGLAYNYPDADPKELPIYIDDATALAADACRETNPEMDYYDIIRTFSYLVETVQH